jgi:pilus assembly protein CpaE
MLRDGTQAGAGSLAPRILVVTAAPPAEAIVEPLRNEGYRVSAVINASELQSLLDAGQRHDLVILDSSLEEEELIELRSVLRPDRRVSVLRIVPADQFQAHQRLDTNAGLTRLYLSDPFEAQDLTAKVAELLLRVGKRAPRLATATQPASTKLSEALIGEPEASLIAVFSPKGGVGKTTIAANVAASLAAYSGNEVLLADCDLYFGGVASLLNLEERRTWLDAVQFLGTNDTDGIADALTPFRQGLVGFSALLTPTEAAESRQVRSEHVVSLLALLRRYFDVLIADLHSTYDDASLGVLDTADKILLVVTPEVSAMHNLTRFMELANHFGYVEKLQLVVNRYNSGIDLGRLQEVARRPVVATIESAGRLVVEAANRGMPFVLTHRDAQVSRDIARLGGLLGVQRARRERPQGGMVQRADVAALITSMRPRLPRLSTEPPSREEGSRSPGS